MKRLIALSIGFTFVCGGSLTSEASSDAAARATPVEASLARQASTTGTEEPRLQVVHNALEFRVPRQQLRRMNLKTVVTKRDAGRVIVPTAALTDFRGKSAVFIALGADKYALRLVLPDSTRGEDTLVSENLNADEAVVVQGVDKLRAGALALRQDQGHGHSHGSGGHSHGPGGHSHGPGGHSHGRGGHSH